MDLSDDQLAELERIRGRACCMEPERRFMAEIENAALGYYGRCPHNDDLPGFMSGAPWYEYRRAR